MTSKARRFPVFLCVAAFCALPVTAFAQTAQTAQTAPPAPVVSAPTAKPILPDAEKERAIRQMITLTGGDKIGQQMMDRMIPEMQKMLPQVPDAFWQEYRKKAKISELIDRTIPVYDKYYTKEDVQGLIQFYQTPLGQKVITVSPDIMRDVQAVARPWGEAIAKEIIQKLEAQESAKPAAPAAVKPKPSKRPVTRKKPASS